MRASVGAMVATSTWSGISPCKPSITALWLPWPLPVAPNEPYSSQRTRLTCAAAGSASKAFTNRAAAFMGPTVCELLGPIPILKRSKVLMAMV